MFYAVQSEWTNVTEPESRYILQTCHKMKCTAWNAAPAHLVISVPLHPDPVGTSEWNSRAE